MRASSLVFFATLAAFVLLAAIDSPRAKDSPEKAALKAISGLWYTQDKDGVVQLYPCDGEICGRFYWLKDDSPEDISRDTHNPEAGKRARPLCRMQFMGGFDPAGNGLYEDGWIYSPRHGANFSAEMTLVDKNTLKLHGYLLVPALGEDQTWTRAKKPPRCVTG